MAEQFAGLGNRFHRKMPVFPLAKGKEGKFTALAIPVAVLAWDRDGCWCLGLLREPEFIGGAAAGLSRALGGLQRALAVHCVLEEIYKHVQDNRIAYQQAHTWYFEIDTTANSYKFVPN